MKAAVIHKFGGPEVLKIEELPEPVINENQLLIRTVASSINPVDWKHREGNHKLILGAGFPIVLGYDVSGEVVKCGQKITKFKPGDKVFGDLNNKYGGALAEYVIANEKCVVKAPGSIPLDDSAALPLAALTALQALRDKGKIKEGHKVMIIGAAGGVGHLAVQICKIFKAQTTAVASGLHKEMMNQLEPDEFIDYTKTDIFKSGKKYDIIFDAAGVYSYLKCKQILSIKGCYITTLPRPKLLLHKLIAFFSFHKVKTLLRKHIPGDLHQIRQWVDEKKIKVFISNKYSFDSIVEAHKKSQDYHNEGKIVINISR